VKGYLEIPTLLADGRAFLRDITPDILSRAIVRPRRRVLGQSRLLRLFQSRASGESLLRWDEAFLKPASAVGELAYTAMKANLAEATVTPIPMANLDDIVVIDNWRMLHARPEIPRGLEDRQLERVYLRRLN
jgi:L-asparagine oxygenase